VGNLEVMGLEAIGLEETGFEGARADFACAGMEQLNPECSNESDVFEAPDIGE
jgi:hypothetical protein